MGGIGVGIMAYIVQREKASRPPDERHAGVQTLDDAARAQRDRTEARDTVTAELRTEAVTTDDFV